MLEQVTIDRQGLIDAVLKIAEGNDGYILVGEALKILTDAGIDEFKLARFLGLNFDPTIGNFQGLSALFSNLTSRDIKVRRPVGLEA